MAEICTYEDGAKEIVLTANVTVSNGWYEAEITEMGFYFLDHGELIYELPDGEYAAHVMITEHGTFTIEIDGMYIGDGEVDSELARVLKEEYGFEVVL